MFYCQNSSYTNKNTNKKVFVSLLTLPVRETDNKKMIAGQVWIIIDSIGNKKLSDERCKAIRRYFKYGDTVVLKPDNPDEGFEIVINHENEHQYRIFRVIQIIKHV